MSYESSVNKLLELASDYKTITAELKPGMKIGVISPNSNKTIVRTVKEATKDKDTLRISFEETCDVVTNITRIDDYTTWFMNAEECTDIARAIRWKYIVNYI